MLTKILVAAQKTAQKYPGGLTKLADTVKGSLNWLQTQPVGAEVNALYKRLSFNVNVGPLPELGLSNVSFSKNSGETKVYGSNTGRDRFTLTVDGLTKYVAGVAVQKRSDASAKAAEAKAKAEEAQRLAAEAARLAEVAEAEAATFENAVSAFRR